MYPLAKQVLFRLDAENAHELTFSVLEKVQHSFLLGLSVPDYRNLSTQAIKLGGLTVRNRLGLAAGLDKNARLLKVWERLGFGHIEVGTITPKPQSGNEKPRLFRLLEDHALINRMGFNNDGAAVIAKRLENRPAGLIVGANIGKNKDTSAEGAHLDYITCLQVLHPVCDYFTINVSSPNTPGLRDLQHKEELYRLLSEVKNANEKLSPVRPLWVKIAPDLSEAQAEDILLTATQTGMTGIVATNTTVSREHLKTDNQIIQAIGNGGLSGFPLKNQSNQILSLFVQGDLPVIGVGGIMNADDAIQKINAGAKMVQIYTGLIYQGPELIKQILSAFRSLT